MASCRQIESLIQGYIDGEATESERLIFEEHVSECRVCSRALKRHKRSTALLFEVFDEHRLRLDLTPAVMAHLPEMDRSSTAVREVNWRAKHAGSGMTWFLRLVPALAPVLIIVLALAIFYSWPKNGNTASPTIGMVTFRHGQVMRSAGDSTERQSVSLSSYVSVGERFETGDDAAMMLSLAGPTEIKVAEDTRIKVHDERQISVERGRAWLHVGKNVRLFRVNTPPGNVVVFGTTFDVRVEEDMTVVTVAEGRVQVENDVAFREINAGEQVVLRIGKRPLESISVDAETELAWANDITPDTGTQRTFAETVKPIYVAHMPAEQVFVVQTNGRAVQSLTFEWKPEQGVANQGGYYVYVYDDHMNQLFSDHIRPEVFQVAECQSCDIMVPGEPIRDVRVLHIKVVPDGVAGDRETTFTKVSAWGIYP